MSYGTFPMVGVLGLDVTLHIAASRKAHEGRMQGLQFLSQVYSAAVLAALEGGREQAYHIQQNGAFPFESQVEDCLRTGLSGHDGCLNLLPAFLQFLFDNCLA